MSKMCDCCGKKTQTDFRVSHSHKRSKRKFFPNLQTKTVRDQGNNRLRLRLCTKCIKSISK